MSMNAIDGTGNASAEASRERALVPIATLLVLSPLIGEVMSGATLLSYIVVLVPEIMVWGCGALVIRDVVRRWGGSWTSVLLLGFGLAIAEEFIIQQTSIAPLPWMGASPVYGRVWGVNWPYLAFMLGFEPVFMVLVPVQITELMFPERRHEAWLHRRGYLLSTLAFLVGSFVAWFSWTQMARPYAFHAPPYEPPALTLLAGFLAIGLLAVAARAARGAGQTRTASAHNPPRPWLVAIVALLLGFPWYGLMVVVFGRWMDLPLWIPMTLAGAWGLASYGLIGRWTTTSGWQDPHRWALSMGALLVCMIAGFLGAGAWSRTDTIAKAVMNLAAVGCMAALAVRIARRPAI
jgi:hypothetical protein